jgi:hypothetical protein
VVDLTNPTQQRVILDPCPVYTESLANVLQSPQLTNAVQSYQLNCGTVSIPAGQSVRFAMRLAVPSDAVSGPGILRWRLSQAVNTAAVAVASAEIAVTGPVRPTVTSTP